MEKVALFSPASGPAWLPKYTRDIERELQKAFQSIPSRAKMNFLYG